MGRKPGLSANTNALDVASYYRIEEAATTDYFGRETAHLTTVCDISAENEETPATVVGKISTEYEYSAAADGKTNSLVEKYINKTFNGNSLTHRVYDGYYYEYDKQNKISAEKALNQDGTTADRYSYVYDKAGQLVRYNSAVENKTYTYAYDNNGNITAKNEYAYTTGTLGAVTNTTTYGYDLQWKDKLTSVGTQAIAYDSIGNPTTYLGATLTWEGRNLTSYENEDKKLTFSYDENGMRYRTTTINKADNSVGYTDYVWADSKLISISFISDELNQSVKYLYDNSGSPVGFISTRADGSIETYYYLKNAQGDITHIVNANGKKMVSFTYDAFGKRTVTYHANGSTPSGQIELLNQMKADLLNPFAYRGYCYDYDMGIYYLQSRYYDPDTGRFINSDSTDYLNYTGTVLGCNLFAYCENDPVNFVDILGYAKAPNVISGSYNSLTYSGNYRALYNKNHYRLNCYIGGTNVFADYYNGIISVWNKQSNIYNIFKYSKTKTFAYTLKTLSQKINSSSLKGRSVNGIAYELIAHYVWFRYSIKLSSTEESDCGSATKGTYGYDSNAYIFENDRNRFNDVQKYVAKGQWGSALVKLAPTLAKLGWDKVKK